MAARPPRPETGGFSERFRVRYAEVDAQAIVFNAHYLTYLDQTFTEYMRHLGLTLEQQQAAGLEPVLARTSIHFAAPARLDDLLEVCPRITRLGRTSLTLVFDVHRAEAGVSSPSATPTQRPGQTASPLVVGESLYVNVDLATGRPVEIPPAVRRLLEPEVVQPAVAAPGVAVPPGVAEPGPFELYLEVGTQDGWCMVHCPDLPGLGFKTSSKQAAVALAPGLLAAELAWAERFGVAALGHDFAVAAEVNLPVPVATGDTEAVFGPELEPLDEAYLGYALAYAAASRRALLDLADRLGPELQGWRPADGKRTIGEVLGHIADAEAFYAVRLEDLTAMEPPAAAALWKEYAGRDVGLDPAGRLERTRRLVLERLARLTDADRRRVTESRGETWTARKALRRLVWHERYHTRQIEAWLQA